MNFEKRKTRVKHKLGTSEGTRIEVEYSYPQYSDFDEFVAAAGSPEAGLQFVNNAVKDEAGGRVREVITDAPETGITEAEIKERAAEAGKGFQPIARSTNKEKAAELDTILARVRTEGASAVAEDLLALAARLA
ncbi:hypothetical protein LCGC14_0915410 [marine sediment metagenome]|uniref:Uncharacterized protein n=1 Tax=marine sediment metagenome TaxID=412755 RepID=A0A0F9PD58_9ZZZZ